MTTTGDAERGVRDLPTVEMVDIEKVREAEENPRTISTRAVDVLALSLERFGWKQPLVVDGDGRIIVGHTRHRAARKLGLTRVPVIIADDLTPAEVDAYRIADNRTHDFTTWDLPALVDQLDALADDFSDVLALADWEAVAAELENAGNGGGENELTLPEEVEHALDGGFVLTVHFHSREAALAAEEAIIELPGAFDVRHDHA